MNVDDLEKTSVVDDVFNTIIGGKMTLILMMKIARNQKWKVEKNHLRQM